MGVDGHDVSIRAWRPPVPGIREVLHARFIDHAYPLHTHDAWTLFIVDDGAIRYDLDGRERAADPSMVSVLPPHVVHDGRPGASDGYRKRVLYLEPWLLGDGLIGQAVDRPVVYGPRLRDDIVALHDRLTCLDDALEAETRLAFVAERIRASLGEPASQAVDGRDARLAEHFRGFLDSHAFEPLTMAAAAAALEASPTRLARAFSHAFGIAPHAYVVGRRIDAARDRILHGQPLAEVAAEVGFVDQAHLTHHFKRFLGITPGRFARGGAATGVSAR